jgi:hypothetical protein
VAGFSTVMIKVQKVLGGDSVFGLGPAQILKGFM